MKIYTQIVIDLLTGKVLSEQSYEYVGNVAGLKGGGGGGGTGTQNTQANIPAELKPLVTQSAAETGRLQQAHPMDEFFSANPEGIAPQGENQLFANQAARQGAFDAFTPHFAGGESLISDPGIWAAQNMFERTALPGIQNRAAVAGLGRSSALPAAEAMGEAEFLGPAINAALGREQQALTQRPQAEQAAIRGLRETGADTQQTAQARFAAAQNDFLRRQQLGEQTTLGPIQTIGPSLIGSSSTSTQQPRGGGK